MRARFRTRRFRTISDARAFAVRLRNGRDSGPRARPVARVLRRMPWPVLQRMWMPLHFALQVIQRGAAPWSPPPAASAPLPPPRPAGILRERFHLCTRLLERRLRVLQVQRGAVPVSIALPAHASLDNAPAPEHRVVMQRLERQAWFPRVTQVLARAPSAAVLAGQVAGPAAPRAPDRWHGPLPGTPRSAAPAATALPAVELARVTDHVIRQLDQRVLSYRERTGQL